MLHLSLLHLPRDDARWRALDLYQAHQLVWKAFPDLPRGDRPFLFSLDARGRNHSLLVQSTHAPAWSFLGDEARIQSKTFDPSRFSAGDMLGFFVRSNPTVSRRHGEGRGKRQPLGLGRAEEQARTGEEPPEREEQIRAWLQRQGERGGFRIEAEECLVGPSVRRVIARTRERDRPRQPMVLHEVELTGRLTITDVDDFKQTLAQGIGRARAFGFGLLMLKPA